MGWVPSANVARVAESAPHFQDRRRAGPPALRWMRTPRLVEESGTRAGLLNLFRYSQVIIQGPRRTACFAGYGDPALHRQGNKKARCDGTSVTPRRNDLVIVKKQLRARAGLCAAPRSGPTEPNRELIPLQLLSGQVWPTAYMAFSANASPTASRVAPSPSSTAPAATWATPSTARPLAASPAALATSSSTMPATA